jgi:tRNA threonylcarbamoyladenosine biosynthesis protein TsaB
VTSGGPLLVVDTATTHAVVALGSPDGALVEARSWMAGYRHGEELLVRLEGLLHDRGVAPADLGGLIVGTGPGAFTGLRVGLATVKGLAHALALPVVGVATGRALADAAAGGDPARIVLLQPAGPSDHVLSRAGAAPRILAGGSEPELGEDEVLVAVDLEGRAPADAVARGELARAGLAAALLAAGAARLRAGDVDDLALLVPEYVTLPRGVREVPAGTGVELSGGAPRP